MGEPTQNDGTATSIGWSDEYDNNGPKRQSDYVGIRQATKKGYIECAVGGVADFSYPNSSLRRGRVQGGRDMPYDHCNANRYMQGRKEKNGTDTD